MSWNEKTLNYLEDRIDYYERIEKAYGESEFDSSLMKSCEYGGSAHAFHYIKNNGAGMELQEKVEAMNKSLDYHLDRSYNEGEVRYLTGWLNGVREFEKWLSKLLFIASTFSCSSIPAPLFLM